MVDSRGMFLKREVTERQGFLRVYFNIILVNLSMEGSLDTVGFRGKVYNDLGGIVITH